LRGKDVTARDLVVLGKRIRSLTAETGALLIINDRLDAALAIGADGVHLGADDLPLRSARKLTRRDFIIGASVDTPEEAKQAEKAGASYLGAGPIYPTQTKETDNPAIGPEGLEAIVKAVSIPVVGIGGIDSGNIEAVTATGVAGAAVVSAVVASPDPEASVRALRSGGRSA
jgi:thiamine-phosphate diphosphorylase